MTLQRQAKLMKPESKTANPSQPKLQRCDAKKIAGLPVHPMADMFPMIAGDALVALKEDITRQGQKEPILIANGMLIDGRNRLKACVELKIKVRVKELQNLTDAEITQRIISLNVHRRHLTVKQRASLARDYYDAQRPNPDSLTQDQVAKLFGVSRRSIGYAGKRGDGSRQHRSKPLPPLSIALRDITNRLARYAVGPHAEMIANLQGLISDAESQIAAR